MNKTKTIITWTVTSLLAVFLVLLGLVYILPGYDLYLVRSGSMTPAILTGDLIITGPVGGFINGTIEPGMVVTYKHGADLITHRVVAIQGNSVVMKGDALQHPDPWTVTLTDVTRVYLFKIPLVGFILNFMRTKFGWFMAIIVPSAILIGLIIKEILKETFKEEKKVTEKTEVKVNKTQKGETRRQEVINTPQPVLSKAQAESNARLRRILTEAMEAQKTSNR